MLIVNNAAGKCHGQAPDGTQICDKRDHCGRYLRPEGDRQAWGNYWKAGDKCQSYESVPDQYHITDDVEEPAKVGWD